MGWGKKLCKTWPRRIRERGWPRPEKQQWREVVRRWAPAGGRAKGSASVTPMVRSQEEATPASEETSCQKSGGDVRKCSVMETGGSERVRWFWKRRLSKHQVPPQGGSGSGRPRATCPPALDALPQGDFSKLPGSWSIRRRLSGRFKDSGGNGRDHTFPDLAARAEGGC